LVTAAELKLLLLGVAENTIVLAEWFILAVWLVTELNGLCPPIEILWAGITVLSAPKDLILCNVKVAVDMFAVNLDVAPTLKCSPVLSTAL
jgi:hypothetical protein